MKQKLWCCVGCRFDTPYYLLSSLSEYRKDSIAKTISNTDLTWEYWKKRGWKCIKVEVEIKPIVK